MVAVFIAPPRPGSFLGRRAAIWSETSPLEIGFGTPVVGRDRKSSRSFSIYSLKSMSMGRLVARNKSPSTWLSLLDDPEKETHQNGAAMAGRGSRRPCSVIVLRILYVTMWVYIPHSGYGEISNSYIAMPSSCNAAFLLTDCMLHYRLNHNSSAIISGIVPLASEMRYLSLIHI